MKAKFHGSYKKIAKNGQPITMFRYIVTGTEEELAQYKEIKENEIIPATGEGAYRETEDGEPLMFSTRFVGSTCDLIVTQNDRVVPDMSRFDQAASLASQYGGNLGTELARIAASQLIGSAGAVAQQVAQPKPETEAKDGGSLDKD